MNNMGKMTPPAYIARIAVVSSLIAALGMLFLKPLSMAGGEREELFRNCAELQNRLNDRNNHRGKYYQGFEKAEMRRRNFIHESYIIYCNGGILTTTDRVGVKVCRGYIAYSYNPVPADANYFSSWGRTEGQPNFNDTGQENYCRWKKKF